MSLISMECSRIAWYLIKILVVGIFPKLPSLTAPLGAAAFNQNLNSWDVSNVTQDRTFLKAINFNSDLNCWDVLKSMHFENICRSKEFNGNISSWNTESLRSLRRTFDGAGAFNKRY